MTLTRGSSCRSPVELALALVLVISAPRSANAQQLAVPYAAPGSMVDVGGRQLHLNCTGDGSPAVVVENGGGAFSVDWALIQPAISRLTRICTYDRAGHAWSDPGPVRDLPDQVVSDFALLL